MNYDSTSDVMKHHSIVEGILNQWAIELSDRGERHDMSKLEDPIEKLTFDRWFPKMAQASFASEEYALTLSFMGEGLQRHYEKNRHHPEHFKNGVNDMTLVDLLELLADWIAVSEKKGTPLDLDKGAERFHIDKQLKKILENTLVCYEVDKQERHASYLNNAPPEMPSIP